ncbi:uncharacterized protein LOC125682122 isoform X2 [Ostrea edulis]|uniref:uncharacterized protein LOC125682122 isoform X2 n=1 Tax=Ostrea edulis TaxID=37623 RepID=UPI0024AF70E2|nr:uncharacterized protein LOC125682122 isoform X2 [Ostrea edulis]
MMVAVVVIFFFLVFASQAAQDYKYVSTCPSTSSEWQQEATRKNCREPTPDYLCAAEQNSPGRYGEICTKYGLFPAGTCAVLNQQTHNMDAIPCKAPVGCPDEPYSPRNLYNWLICFGDFYGPDRTESTTATTIPQNTTIKTSITTHKPEKDPGSGWIAGVIIVLLLVLVGLLVILYILDKKKKWGLWKAFRTRVTDIIPRFHGRREQNVVSGENQDEERAEKLLTTPLVSGSAASIDGEDAFWKLTALHRYLVVSLKHYIGIEELKDKLILFKSSLIENFNEFMLEPLHNLQSWDDYEELDSLLVYNLLRNICNHIHPPKRGWDYEPDIEDDGLGADIERVRLMWNKYCDGETVFDQINVVYARMQERYGNISQQIDEIQDGETCSLPKEKISPSVELKPECEVDDGIVIRKGIKSVIEILGENKMVICKGAIGCGKTTCLKHIEKIYKGMGWHVKWKEGTLSTHGISENKTLLCCDNMFGTYNRGEFVRTSDVVEFLETHEGDSDMHVKIVLAIHDHVFDELQKNNLIRTLQNKRLVVDMNELSDAETMLIFKDQRRKGHCTMDPNCWFRKVDFESLKRTLQRNTGFIGDPVLTLLYSNHHDIFATEEATRNPFQKLCSKVHNMSTTKPELFNVLVYMMFVGSHRLDLDVQRWATEKPFHLTTEKIQQNIRHLHAYIDGTVDGRTIRMKHELLSLALFHVCAMDGRYLPALLTHCRIQMIEELLRPASTVTWNNFCFILDESNFQALILRIVGEKLLMNLKNHPLMENVQFHRKLKDNCSREVWRKIFPID